MMQHSKGQIIKPTGSGKTLTMIAHTISLFEEGPSKTIVVVAPRILLAQQLCSEFLEHIMTADVLHVHSGETHHHKTTKAIEIYNWCRSTNKHRLIFTTYNSLQRIQQANINVDAIYFDEAHNSVKRNFFPATKHFSSTADRCYFFTATPKHSATSSKPGMNDVDVYGNVICEVSAPELVEGGYIVPPKVVVKELQLTEKNVFKRDCNHIVETIDSESINKVLVCAKATKQIIGLFSESDFYLQMKVRGYSVMYITSKTGAFIDGQKVNRDKFFETLNAWGKDDTKKFVVLHHSILAEGINVSGLEGVIFMRSMDYIGISQTIGRVIRLHHADVKGLRDGLINPGNLQEYTKSFGLVCIPVYNSVGISTAKKIQTVVDIVFEQGNAAVSVIKK